MFAFFGFAASANNVITVYNSIDCPGATITVQFYSYHEGDCMPDVTTVPYAAATGASWDLCDDATWLGPLWMASYETFTAVVCIKCPDGKTVVCSKELYIDMNPGHACVTQFSDVLETPCCGPIRVEVLGGFGGGSCFHLNIHH